MGRETEAQGGEVLLLEVAEPVPGPGLLSL